MQIFGTFLHQVSHLHTTKTCSALPPLIFTLAKPLARSTHCSGLPCLLCSFSICFETQRTWHQLSEAIYQLTLTKYVQETTLCSGLQLQSLERRPGLGGDDSPQTEKLNWGGWQWFWNRRRISFIGRGRESTRASLDSFVGRQKYKVANICKISRD